MTQTGTSWEQEVRDRQEFRSQMVQNFGFTVMDHGVALLRCPRCAALTAINSAFPDSDWNSLDHLLNVLESYLESRSDQILCGACRDTLGGPACNGDFEYWLWHAHFLPESKRDLQLLIHRRNGTTDWVEGMLVDEAGQICPITLPASEVEFRPRAGCFFSVRQAWKDFLHDNWPVSRFGSLEISDGYYLIVNPPVDSDADLQEFKENCVRLVGRSSSSSNQYEFADLSWADTWSFEENTYHQWLSEFERDLEDTDVIAGVLASPPRFYEIVQAELRPFGCWLRREGDNTPVAFLGDDEYYVSFDYREFLINAMIKGYSYWGALKFVEPVLESWEQARETGERLKALLSAYSCTVYGGHYFQCRTKRGRKIVKEFDLTRLSECDDDLEENSAFISWIAPQIELDPQTLKFLV